LISFSGVPQLMVVGAKGDEIPWVVVIMVSIKMMYLHDQTPTANALF